MWEVISAISGTISALCDVSEARHEAQTEQRHPGSMRVRSQFQFDAVLSFLLRSIGWCLLVLSFVWIFEPFGSYVSDRDWLKVFGAMVGMPALVLLSGINTGPQESSKEAITSERKERV
jgi:hypothetical protein